MSGEMMLVCSVLRSENVWVAESCILSVRAGPGWWIQHVLTLNTSDQTTDTSSLIFECLYPSDLQCKVLLIMRKATDGLKNVNNLLMSLLGTPRGSLVVKSQPITEEYKISTTVLGLGINGKVVECFDQVTRTA